MEKETPATLHDAARVGDVARLEELLEAGKARGKKIVDVVDNNGMTAMYTAALHGRKEVIALLTANGANVKATGPSGYERRGPTADDYERLATHHPLLEPPWGETESFSVGKEGAVGRAAAPEVKQPKRGGVAAYQQELMSR